MASGKPDSSCKWCEAGLPRYWSAEDESAAHCVTIGLGSTKLELCTAQRVGEDRRKQERRIEIQLRPDRRTSVERLEPPPTARPEDEMLWVIMGVYIAILAALGLYFALREPRRTK